ncbi:unnamed protein product [Effrenium voratum]|uniref:Uncharacterized protein n=1 Tax=Effrenium voratum TaxID=2562239 RepID=A0AA36N5Y7_9DINO|nr:unnamed protein product [Effrenium voratum]CAJ1430173.1 unnamed protein product [Effrenium voratum]
MWSPAPHARPVAMHDARHAPGGYTSQSFRIEAPSAPFVAPRMVSSPARDVLSQTCARQVPPQAVHMPVGGVPGNRSPYVRRAPAPLPLRCAVGSPCSRMIVRTTTTSPRRELPRPATAPQSTAVPRLELRPVPGRVLAVRSPLSPALARVGSPLRVSPKKMAKSQEDPKAKIPAAPAPAVPAVPVAPAVPAVAPESPDRQVEKELQELQQELQVLHQELSQLPKEELSNEKDETEKAEGLQGQLSQTSTIAPEDDRVTRTVRALPPRPQHAPEKAERERLEPLVWECLPDRHPVEAEGERHFVGACLDALADTMAEAGGVQRYMSAGQRAYQWAVCKAQDEDPTMPALRWALEDIIQSRVRTGAQGVFVQQGWMMSMGNKKVVKLCCRCEGSEGKLSVCWDWDVKLEPKEK